MKKVSSCCTINGLMGEIKDTTKNSTADKVTRVLLIIYLAALLWIIEFKLGVRYSYMQSREVNFLPFSQAFVRGGQLDWPEMIMNVIIFIPLGIYSSVLFKHYTFVRHVFLCFLVSLICEALQFILVVGTFDVTDLITNTTGGTIGILLYKLVEKVLKSSRRAQQFINIVASTGTVLTIFLLLLLKLNMLPVRYQ